MKPGYFSALLLLLASYALASNAASLDHNLEVELNPETGAFRISDRVEVSGLSEYRFPLAPWLDQHEVRLDTRSVELQHDGDAFLLPLAAGKSHWIEFELRGTLPERGAADQGSSYAADGVYLPGYDSWLPHPVGMPLSYRMTVLVPPGYRAVASGKLLADSEDARAYQASFIADGVRELPSLFAGPYEVSEQLRDGLRLRTYFHPGLESFSGAYLDAAGDYIERYRRDIGDYPYADFHVVTAPLPVGLGFPGLTYVDRRIIPLPFMRTRSLAHEVLHSWWGNAVGVDYASGNWAEGLTTFMADYRLERDKGEQAAREMRVRWLRDYAALPASRDRAVRAFRSRQHQASQVIGYNKAAFVFHMLMREIGEPAFDEGIRHFWREQQFKQASWRDLQASFEAVTGRDLGWFFRQWLQRSGAPRLSLGKHSVTPVDGGYLTRVEIIQTVAGYRFGLDVELQSDSGSETRRINIDATRSLLEWMTPERPQSIAFDPGNDLFRRLQAAEAPPILRDITLNAQTATLLVGDVSFRDAARKLAARMLDTPPNFIDSAAQRTPQRPLLLFVPRDLLEQQLAALDVTLPAGLPDKQHRAAAWTARLVNATPVLVVTADSAAELEALLRPLPHYGGQSYVLFTGGKAQARGLWPIERGSLYRDLRATP